MPRFIHSIVLPNQAVAADGELTVDLPVNPLTAIIVHLNPLNETSTETNFQGFAGLLSALDNLTVAYRGTNVIDMTGGDLAAWLLLGTPYDVAQANMVDTDDERRSLSIPVPFARRLYDPNECFPETKRGELILTMTLDIADTGFDALRVSVEAIELPEASPAHFQRVTSISQTFAAVGYNDVDLPLGNVIRGLLLFGTTGYAGAAPAPTWGEVRLLLDNMQYNYASTDWEVSKVIRAMTRGGLSTYHDHRHNVNAGAAAYVDSLDAEIHGVKQEHYSYLDCDPTDDDMYSIPTSGAGRCCIRADAEAADAARVCVVEKMECDKFLSR